MAEPEGVSPEAVRDEIAQELLKVQEDTYGVGARDISVNVLDDIVLVVIDVELAVSERTLLNAGHGDAVKAAREAFQDAIASTFKAIVERATGRRVDSFDSYMNVESMYAVEFFRLHPDSH
jgi:uncharacterized protein YbcI